jgi:hypothetical protein
MDNKEIEKLLKSDNSEPKVSPHEWSLIRNKLSFVDKEDSLWFFKKWLSLGTVLASFILLLAVSVPLFKNDKNIQERDYESLANYLFLDSFPELDEPTSSWIDDLT